MKDECRVYTIGYSGYRDNLAGFVVDLQGRGINVLVDVRSEPYSVTFPEFDRERLEKYLAERHIAYRNYAREFGAKQLDTRLYSDFSEEGVRQIDYERVRRSENFRQGVEKLQQIIRTDRSVALMCSEKDPLHCHRAILIAYALHHDDAIITKHIVPQRVDETQLELEERLKQTICEETLRKRLLNPLEVKLKRELELESSNQLFEKPDTAYLADMQTYYRIMNAKIGWKWENVLGYS